VAVDQGRGNGLSSHQRCHLDKVYGYFRKDWKTELISDASPVGLGGVLCQFNPKDPTQRHIVCIFSRLLTEVERRYSQAEKEALGFV